MEQWMDTDKRFVCWQILSEVSTMFDFVIQILW